MLGRQLSRWCFLTLLAVLGCTAAPQGTSVSGPASSSAGNSRTWKTYPADRFVTRTLYSPDAKLQVTSVEEKDLRSWWYSDQIRLHYVESPIPDTIFSWTDSPGSAWYPLFTHAFSLYRSDHESYLLLGWTSEGFPGPVLHAWEVTVDNSSISVHTLSVAGPGVRLCVNDGAVGVFLPDTQSRAATENGSTSRCEVKVDDTVVPDQTLRAGLRPAPLRTGFWYTRPRNMDVEPGPGHIRWFGPNFSLVADGYASSNASRPAIDPAK